MSVPIPHRTAVYGLSILGAVIALVVAVSFPTSFEVTRDTGTEVIVEDAGVYPFGTVMLIAGCLTSALLITALFAIRRGTGAGASGKTLLLIAGIIGLVPLLIPGVLILIARVLLIHSRPGPAPQIEQMVHRDPERGQ